MLANDKIEAIRARLDIVQIVGAYVTLKKQGQRFVGLCPFHGEKTPSFSVSSEKGLFYCFGCHEGGDAFGFVMKHDGLSFHEAARRLGEQVGVPLDPESPKDKKRREVEEEIARVNRFALAFFQHELTMKKGLAARAYLKERGVPEEAWAEWRLGFGGVQGELLKYLEAKRVKPEQAAQAGLLTDDGQRCLFDGRLVFPVFDPVGRLAGFGGRRLGDGSSPKYINTRESALFKKRQLLFGWEHAENAVRRGRRAIVVEGYMDVLACHAAGLTQAVAALGTAFSDDHARHLGRLAREVVVLMDGDAAGQAASVKVAERLLNAKLATRVAALPPGQDPDSTLKKQGAGALVAAVEAAQPVLEHFMGRAFAGPLPDVEARAQAARELWPLFLALGPGLEHDLYLARLAEKVGLPVEQLHKHLSSLPVPRRRSDSAAEEAVVVPVSSTPATTAPPVVVDTKASPAELAVVRELLMYPNLRPRLAALAEYALSDAVRNLLEALAQGQATPDELVERYLGDDKRARRLLSVSPAADDNEAAARAERTYNDVLARLKARHVDAALRDVIRELSEAESRGDETNELIRRKQDLTRRKLELLAGRRSA